MKKGLTLVEIMVAIALFALIGSFILPRIFEVILVRNELSAKTNLRKIISPALENYARNNNGAYASSEHSLLQSRPPYLNKPYHNRTIQGYTYTLDLSNICYTVLAKPDRCGQAGTGRKIYSITTGSIFNETECN